jgi:hypothetical protein
VSSVASVISPAVTKLARGDERGSMVGRALRTFLAGILVAAVVIAPTAFAAKPTIERIDIDDTFDDEFLTEECGVPVTTHAKGHIIIRTFSGDGTGVAEVRTISLGFTAMAGDNTYRFRDVGSDHVQIQPDGTAILMITGQVPFEFSGVLKIDLETGEVIHEPRHSLEGNLEKACAALTA